MSKRKEGRSNVSSPENVKPQVAARGSQKVDHAGDISDVLKDTAPSDRVQASNRVPVSSPRNPFIGGDIQPTEAEQYCRDFLPKVFKLRMLFGFDVVLVPIVKGSKTPISEAKGYPDFTVEKMEDIKYLSQLEEGGRVHEN
jgi:hypothetical protein